MGGDQGSEVATDVLRLHVVQTERYDTRQPGSHRSQDPAEIKIVSQQDTVLRASLLNDTSIGKTFQMLFREVYGLVTQLPQIRHRIRSDPHIGEKLHVVAAPVEKLHVVTAPVG